MNNPSELSRRQSELVYDNDPGDIYGAANATNQKYDQNNFIPSQEVNKFSYTSGRVAKRVYNLYEKSSQRVIGYYTDWSQYDGRYENNFADDQCGRGIDLMKLDPFAYDKLIIGFLGIVGDKGEKSAVINRAANDFNKSIDEATFVDAWGDVASYRNCGFSKWVSNDYLSLFNQSSAQGVLGGLSKIKEENPELVMSFSVGGWTMSEAFYHMVRDANRRQVFVKSLKDIYSRFPMFTEIDVDWEYPGMVGNGNTFADDDADYFIELIKDIKSSLPDIKVSIAAGASPVALEKSNIPDMLKAGVEYINLMTYDFFGTPWAPSLAHHTNLNNLDESNPESYGVDKSVEILLKAGVDSQKINIGYAAYSRNAHNAEITSYSPLVGSYTPGSTTTTGTFESGATEYYDLMYNYIDFENQRGLNGFKLYTDEIANADYLYNPETKLFISLDTPRTVKEKAEYVKNKNLGGLITWTIEMDNGILVNAAREGLGCKAQSQKIDMSNFYFKGEVK